MGILEHGVFVSIGKDGFLEYHCLVTGCDGVVAWNVAYKTKSMPHQVQLFPHSAIISCCFLIDALMRHPPSHNTSVVGRLMQVLPYVSLKLRTEIPNRRLAYGIRRSSAEAS
jgi:hypothetical protein